MIVKRTEEEKTAIEKLSSKIAENVVDSKNPLSTLREISKIGLGDIFIRKGGDELMVREVKGKTMDILFSEMRKPEEEKTPQQDASSTGEETSSTR